MTKSKDGKLPAIQFYPGDWWRDPGVRMLNLEERGFWFQLLLVMHECDRRGYLEVNGRPMNPTEIGRIFGITRAKSERILLKISSCGVLSRETENGPFFSRRMARDEAIRQGNKHNGALGGNPSLKGQPVNRVVDSPDNPPDNRKTTPSSSSSTSTSASTITTPTPSSETGQPETALPGAAPAEPGIPGINGNQSGTTGTKKPRTPKPQPEPIMIPDILAAHPGFAEAWAKWEAYRREGRKTMTASTRNLQLGMLAKHGPTKAIEMMERSRMNGWTGLFEDSGPSVKVKSRHDTRPDCVTNAEAYTPAPCMTDEEAGVAF